MSAEILRQAAVLMRERAEAATPGPWKFGEFCSPKLGDHHVVYRADKDEQGKNWQVATLYGFSNPGVEEDADSAHIASWHPVVTLAVADWLLSVADQQDADLDRYAEAFGLEIGPRMVATDRRALAVARAYLGESA